MTQRPPPRPPSDVSTTPDFEQYWRERFQKFADLKDDDAGIAGWSSTGLRARLRHFMDHWKPNAPASLWLDAGCGAGTYTRHFNLYGMRVVGLDYSHPSLVKAKKKSPAELLFVVADVTSLPLKPNSLDGAVCFGVTQALSDSKTLCRELVQAVRPGAEVWVDGLNRWSLPHVWAAWQRRRDRKPMHLRYESAVAVTNALQNQGLSKIRLLWLPILPSSLARYQWLLETHASRWLFRHVPLMGMLFSHSFVLVGRKTKASAP